MQVDYRDGRTELSEGTLEELQKAMNAKEVNSAARQAGPSHLPEKE